MMQRFLWERNASLLKMKFAFSHFSDLLQQRCSELNVGYRNLLFTRVSEMSSIQKRCKDNGNLFLANSVFIDLVKNSIGHLHRLVSVEHGHWRFGISCYGFMKKFQFQFY